VTERARPHRGVHGVFDAPLPFPVVDACVQIWGDADLDVAHRHGVACYAVTTWLPRVPFTQALAALQAWRTGARRARHGRDHVAARTERFLEGFDDYAQLPSVVEGLRRRGYGDEAVAAMLGGNVLRVFDDVTGARA
jgi:microsomal dipeptidase-like Zn-dependent dipeptidase